MVYFSRVLKYGLMVSGLLFLSACNRVPTPVAAQYLAGDPATVVRMHILHTTDRGLLPLVKVDLAGEKAWWLLDTGSSHNLISPTLARRHKLKAVGDAMVATIGGRKAGTYHALPELKIGTLKLDGQSAGAVDLSGLSTPDGYEISGILGVPAFGNLVVALDYQNRTVRFSNSALPLQQAHMNVIPFTIKGGVPVATLNLTGQQRGDFILDTGNATSLVVLPSYRVPAAKQSMSFMEVEDIGGPIATRLASIPQLQLGWQQFGRVPVSLPINNQRYAAVDGSLGNGLLARQPVIFDFPRKQLLLQPRTASVGSKGTFGFLLAKNNVIQAVVGGSPAALAGLTVGDRIIEADGVNTVQSSAFSIWRQLHGRVSTQLGVFRKGQVATVRLERANFLPLLQ